MRNRTEMVTTTLPGSDNEEEASDLDDSEEDWKPVDKKVTFDFDKSVIYYHKLYSNYHHLQKQDIHKHLKLVSDGRVCV